MKFRFINMLTALLTVVAVQAEPPVESFGVWSKDSAYDLDKYPFLMGCSSSVKWSEVEKQPGVFHWGAFDQEVRTAASKGLYMYLSIGVGPDAPEWIYELGVPKVYTDDKKHANWEYYPYYLSPAYKACFKRLIMEWGRHIRSFPIETQRRIAFIQVKTGCTGDETAYKGEPSDPQYSLPKSGEDWLNFRLWTFDMFAGIFVNDPDHLRIDLLFNDVYPEEEEDGDNSRNSGQIEWGWVTQNIEGSFGLKCGALSRGHHLSGERSNYDQLHAYFINPAGLTLFRRSEMDQTWRKSWYQLNVPLNFYWGAINALNAGQSIWDISNSAMDACVEQGFDYSFYFFNRYAGQIHPQTATDAFCALHKGLDAMDTVAYPEAGYGKASHENIERMQQICAEFAKYGAAIDDPEALTFGQVKQRDAQIGFNDVGWDVWPGNYSRFLYQIDPDTTSVPLWRIGGPITKTSSIYSRFARGFEHASGKDAMYFKLHEDFVQGDQPQVMTITIVWYDGIPGSTWRLDYDAGKRNMQTALTITGKGDKAWHHERVTVKDAIFRHGGLKGADMALVNTDNKDDVFSLIEVHRGEADEPLRLPPADYLIPDSDPLPPKGEKAPRRKSI